MPVLKLHIPEDLISSENIEDLLLQINKDPKADFKSRDELMRALIRNYTLSSLNSLRRWETTRYIPSLTGQPIHVPTLDFWEGDVEGLEDGEEGGLISIPIGTLQYGYLKTVVKWENTYQREILKSNMEHKSVAALARHVILDTLLQAQIKVDEEKMKEEEREILEEEARENSEKDKNL